MTPDRLPIELLEKIANIQGYRLEKQEVNEQYRVKHGYLFSLISKETGRIRTGITYARLHKILLRQD